MTRRWSRADNLLSMAIFVLVWFEQRLIAAKTPSLETALWGATRFSGVAQSTEYGATYCWRLRPPPWVEAEAHRGSGADPRRDLVSAASAELARIAWCQWQP